VATGLNQFTAAGKATTKPLEIDMKKCSGVPAQGQRRAPLGFRNHWIVEVGGKLYDTSYGGIHANNMTHYARDGLAGWLIGTLADPGVAPPSAIGAAFAWLVSLVSSSAAKPTSGDAWCAEAIDSHTLTRNDGSSN
jgi:hypothetical protein